MMKSLMKGILLSVFLLVFSNCRIYDESSTVVVTSPGTLGLTISDITYETIKSGDTTTITTKLVSISNSDTTAVSNARINVSCSDELGVLTRPTITTGEDGLAAVQFTATLPEEVNNREFSIVFTQGELKDTALIFVTKEETIDKSSNLKLNAYPLVIDADRGKSSSEITVSVVDDNNLPIVGETIVFKATAGKLIPNSGSVTDSKGEVTATLYSEEINLTCYVTATLSSDNEKSSTTKIDFKGVTISSSLSKQSIVPNGSDTLIITSTLKNAAQETIGNVPIEFKALSEDLTITFSNDTTSTSGQAICKIVGANNNTSDTVSISAAGVEEKIVINYSSNSISLIKDGLGNSFVANGTSTTQLQVKYLQSDQTTPITNTPVTMSVSAGAIINGTDTMSTTTVNTNSSGIAAFTILNPTFTGDITVNVSSLFQGEKISLTEKVKFIADSLNRLEITGTPEVLTTGGDKATITVTAYDKNDNLVEGDSISFSLLDAPGGSERIEPAVAVTNSDGQATVQFITGDVPSKQQNVLLFAQSFDGKTYSEDTLRFTISDPVTNITISSNIKEITEDANGGFGIKLLTIVSNINSNPVVDGTPVKFSARKSGYAIWRYTFTETNNTYTKTTAPVILPFDDINDNFVKDLGEGTGITYPLQRGEDFVWSKGDNSFRPGPSFIDINCNGRRDYNSSYSNFEKPEPYWPVTAFEEEPEGLLKGNDGTEDVYYMDYNGNRSLDLVEPTYPSISDAEYESGAGYIGNGWYEDIDWNNNGKPEPNMTALSLKEEVLTESGKAPNEMHYGQDDGLRLCVEIWAESKGVRTENSVYYNPLPITKAASEYFDPFKGKTLK